MNKRPLKPCSKPGCAALSYTSYCEAHKSNSHEQRAENSRYYDKYKRNKKHDSFYKSRTWTKCRDYVRARDMGLCQMCLADKRITPGVAVDHKIPLSISWDKRLDEDNLWLLCTACHNKKTQNDIKLHGKS